MRWAYIDALWLCGAPLFVLLCFAFGAWRRQQKLAKVGDHDLVQKLIATFSPERRILKRFCEVFLELFPLSHKRGQLLLECLSLLF